MLAAAAAITATRALALVLVAMGMAVVVIVMTAMLVIMRMVVTMPATAAAFMIVIMVVMSVVVPMAMIVVSPMAVTTTATTALVMLVLVGIDQDGCKAPLQRNRLLARRIARLDRQRHHLGGDADVVHLSQIMPAQTPLAVEDQQRRRSLKLVGVHCFGQRAPVLLVDGNRELVVTLFEESFELGWCLLVGFFKNRMQTNNLDFVVLKLRMQPRQLRQKMAHTARAMHLEGSEHHNLALGRRQGRR